MRIATRLSGLFVAMGMLAGCGASSEVKRVDATGASLGLAKPSRIIVRDFAATPGDIPADSGAIGRFQNHTRPQTQAEIAAGRRLGAEIASQLVFKINAMGLRADHGGVGAPPQQGDLVIRGAIVSVATGSRVERVVIGFGQGANKLEIYAEGLVATPTGKQWLAGAQVGARGGKQPGVSVPLIVGAATGTLLVNAAIGGTFALYSELGPERQQAIVDRAVNELEKLMKDAFRRRGWIS